jgi:uncharacterized repeat protein (TIGR01451 family)
MLVCAAFLTIGLPINTVQGAGTPAGTAITNNATVSYAIGVASFTETSNTTSSIVGEILDVAVAWQDIAPVAVGTGAGAQALTFQITNTGNGTEVFQLGLQNALSGNDFDPQPVGAGLYLDSNGNGQYDPGTDPVYSPGVNDPDLLPDTSQTVFILCDIPIGLAGGDSGSSRLSALAVSGGSGLPGTLHPNAGDNGTDALDGSSGGKADATGTYVVSDVSVALVKSSTVIDPSGGTQPVTGATLSYTIMVTVTGSGTAQNLVITDPIPISTHYSPNTLRLDTNGLTDTADGDAGDVAATTPGAVSVYLGNVVAGSPTRIIEFEVIID